MILDTHQHFWHYDPVEFGWISDEMRAIRRDYLPADLSVELARHDVAGVVAVQARQIVEETRWLCDLATRHGFIRGVVGWLPLRSPDVDSTLDALGPSCSRLVGARHVLQGEDDAFFRDDAFNRGLALLARRGLCYDLLLTERQFTQTIALVDRHPELTFVLDHLGKPDLTGPGPSGAWRRGMTELARRTNVSCKISGGITEADLAWTPAQMRPYFDLALEAFGPERLLFGSNWPVSESAGGYGRWLTAVQDWAGRLSVGERDALLAGNAIRIYKLEQTA